MVCDSPCGRISNRDPDWPIFDSSGKKRTKNALKDPLEITFSVERKSKNIDTDSKKVVLVVGPDGLVAGLRVVHL